MRQEVEAMTDLAQFTCGTVKIAMPRYAVSAVVGRKVYAGPDFFVSVDQPYDEILRRLKWVSE